MVVSKEQNQNYNKKGGVEYLLEAGLSKEFISFYIKTEELLNMNNEKEIAALEMEMMKYKNELKEDLNKLNFMKSVFNVFMNEVEKQQLTLFNKKLNKVEIVVANEKYNALYEKSIEIEKRVKECEIKCKNSEYKFKKALERLVNLEDYIR